MGATGPCGPCSEIHIDTTPDKSGHSLVNAGDARVMELWNLVFMQYNRNLDGKLSPLPARHIDTGAGLERICRILQGKESNYDTDLFTPIIEHAARLTGQKYTADFDRVVDTAFRVIADHVRMLTISITDGARPSNEGRGYVLRRILRRAARFGRQHLGMSKPFIYELVPTVADVLGGAFPDVPKAVTRVSDIIKDEEASFGRTLDRGMKLFFDAVDATRSANARLISGAVAFRLYDEAGFPVDLTRQMAEENKLDVDEAEFNRLMQAKRQRDRAATKGKTAAMQAFDVQHCRLPTIARNGRRAFPKAELSGGPRKANSSLRATSTRAKGRSASSSTAPVSTLRRVARSGTSVRSPARRVLSRSMIPPRSATPSFILAR